MSVLPPPPDVELAPMPATRPPRRAELPDRPWVPVEVLEAQGRREFCRGLVVGGSSMAVISTAALLVALILRAI